jgi:hypothetical protein
MSESDRIADQLQRSQRGPAWHGPPLGELLAGVDFTLAQWRALGGTHNIWEIVLHVTAWQSAALNAVKGGRMPELAGFEDWPSVGSAAREWDQAVERVDRIHRELVAGIEKFPDDRLGETVPGRDYSFYFLLHGIVQHTLYHAGQIALLKAAARNETRAKARQM